MSDPLRDRIGFPHPAAATADLHAALLAVLDLCDGDLLMSPSEVRTAIAASLGEPTNKT